VLVLLTGGMLEAVAPGRSHRARVAAVRAELRRSCPPLLLLESWQSRFFRELHLREVCPHAAVRSPSVALGERDYEGWLKEQEPRLTPGTALVTGLLPYVYYTPGDWGFRLALFAAPLDPRWGLVTELEPVRFDAAREPVRLWRWSGQPVGGEEAAVPVPTLAPAQLFERGIERFDAQDYPGTRAFMGALIDRYRGHVLRSEAAYFLAVSYWREDDPERTIREFDAFLARYPSSRLVGAAHFHIGLSNRRLGRYPEAREAFEATVRFSSPHDPERGYALEALESLPGRAPLSAVGRGFTELVYRFQAKADRLETFLLGEPEP
jgi:tetratricopeptide (TPR) repeat protein